MSEHKLITPRRNFLIRALGFTAAGALASTPVAAAALSPPQAKARLPLKGPITPDQYIQEMLAIGWEPYTITMTAVSGKTINLKGTFETHPDDYFPNEEQHTRRFELQRAVSKSGPYFYEEVGARLRELGMIKYEDYSQT
jgi:hypothetical protein